MRNEIEYIYINNDVVGDQLAYKVGYAGSKSRSDSYRAHSGQVELVRKMMHCNPFDEKLLQKYIRETLGYEPIYRDEWYPRVPEILSLFDAETKEGSQTFRKIDEVMWQNRSKVFKKNEKRPDWLNYRKRLERKNN